MKNWKTTVSGFIAAFSIILPQFGVGVELAHAIQVCATAAFALLAKDNNVTGV